MTEQILFSREYRLTSGGASIHFRAEKNALTITEISNSDNKNILSDETACPLPAQIEINGEKLDIAWTFTGSETTPKENCTEAVFHFKAPEHNLEYMLFCRAWDTPGPFLFEGTVINTASEAIRIIPGNIAAVELDCSDAKAEVWKFSKESGWAEGIRRSDGGEEFKGAGITVTPLAENTNVIAWVNTEQNFNASGSIPLLYVSKGDSGFMMALEWSSGRVSCESSDGKTAVLTATLDGAGPGETVFSTKIAPQGKLDIPPVYVLPYLGDVDNGSNILKSWFFRNRAPKNLPQNTAEPLTQMDMQIGLDADKINVDAVKWDYGWWSDQVFITWRSLEGSWQLRNSAYIGVLNGYGVETLPEFAKLAHDRNVSWTVYLLLHDPLGADRLPTNEFGEFNSVDHPEWFSNRRIAEDMGCSADLGNRECVDFLKRELVKFFSENGIDTWRSDFEPINYYSDKKNRHDALGTDTMYWCSVGFAELINHLIENVDGFRYESCSSGGSMKDLYTARLATVINCDDSAHYLSLRTTFYDSSYCIHPAQLQIPCNTDRFNSDHEAFFPNVTVTDPDESFDLYDTMLDMGYRSQILGVPMFSSWTATLPLEHIRKYATMYNEKLRSLIRHGELYHILPRPDGINWDGVMYADPDSANEIKGTVFLFKPSESAGNSCHVTLRGLDPQKSYTLTFEDRPEQNTAATGESLMTAGIDVEIRYVGSEIIWITEK